MTFFLSSGLRSRRIRNGKAMLSNTVMCGHTAKDWKTMPMLRASGGVNFSARASTMVLPLRMMRPWSGYSRPATMRSVVLLPHPLGPSRVKISP